MIKQIPEFKDVGIDIRTAPSLILYNVNDKTNFISLSTRAEQIETTTMDFLFSSSKKLENKKKGIFSVNITIIIYESSIHHCLLEYKITFKEKEDKETQK
jgi:hypothetical protein